MESLKRGLEYLSNVRDFLSSFWKGTREMIEFELVKNVILSTNGEMKQMKNITVANITKAGLYLYKLSYQKEIK
jgi:hypothetical protein